MSAPLVWLIVGLAYLIAISPVVGLVVWLWWNTRGESEDAFLDREIAARQEHRGGK